MRLRRVGGKNKPCFRIVVCDIRSPRDGRFLESVGDYDPIRGQVFAHVDRERALYWLGKGARPTETVRDIFKRLKIQPHGA